LIHISFSGISQKDYIKFDHLSAENGLPQDHIFCILQDTKGFLWLGTETGLVRYDGYTFKIYEHNPEDTTSISSDIIKSIYQDNDGIFWIGTDGGGLCRFDPAIEKFQTIKHDPEDPNSLSGNRVYSIQQDNSGAFWVGTLGNGLNKVVFDQQSRDNYNLNCRIERFKSNPQDSSSISDNNIWCMLIDDYNFLWIGTVLGGLNKLDLNNQSKGKLRFEQYKHDKLDLSSISSNSIKEIYQDNSGVLWIGTEFSGLNRFESKSGFFYRFQHNPENLLSLSHNYVNTIFEDDSGRFFIGTNGGGLNIFDKKENRFFHYNHIASDPYSLNGELVNTIYQDGMGNIWIGMVNSGLNIIDPQKQKIRHFYPGQENPKSLNEYLVKSIYEDKAKQIWIGTFRGGLSKFHLENGEFTSFPTRITQGSGKSPDNVQTIFEDSNHNFWIGTDGSGLQKFDRHHKVFSNFNKSPSGKTGLHGNSVWALCEDFKGNLWIGTADGGLNKYDKELREFEHFFSDPNNSNSINSQDVRAIYQDKLGILWIGTYGGGLNRYNSVSQEFSHFTHLPDNPQSISNDIITVIFESPSSHQLWIGTFGGGLNLFDRASGIFKAYREKDGLVNDVVKSIQEDHEGNLWISTLKGISKFDPRDESFLNYSVIDGLQGEAFNLGSSCFSSGGSMLFGGTNGFNVFNPKDIKTALHDTSNCYLTDLRIFNHSVQAGEVLGKRVILPKTIDEMDKIIIPHSINGFAFEFAALDFARSNKIQYAYMLENVEEKWQNTDATRRYASYSNLPPGDYVFKIRASNRDGEWNNSINSLKVQILSSPWLTWWAYLIYALLLLLVIFVTRHFVMARVRLMKQLRKERKKRNEIRQLNEMKLRFFTNISHEIRTPLTLILGPLETLITSAVGDSNTRIQLQTMRRNANRLLSLVNQLLEFRKQEEGHTNLKMSKGDFNTFIHEITLSFSEFARQKAIDFSFVPEMGQTYGWYDENKMEKVFFNLLSNAFKFTPENGKISVRIISDEDNITTIVEDNGIGISGDDLPFIFERFYKFDKKYSGNYLGSGIGLALAKSIVNLHQGTISVESQPKEFTRFTVKIPKGRSHFPTKLLRVQPKQKALSRPFTILEENGSSESKLVPLQADAPKLLIVEDNEEVRAYLKEIFGSIYFVSEAINGMQGFKKASSEYPDIIISDILMPEMDGIEFCRKIKTSVETSHIPVILLTARTSLIFRTEGLDTGADDYITKPFNPELLIKRVHNLVESRKRLREKFGKQIKIEPSEVTLSSPDQVLLKRTLEIVENYISDDDFNVNVLAKEVGLSRAVLYRKIPAITNYTPNEFIRVMRLKRAAQLLSQNVMSISEICYTVGFKTPKYFSKCFRELFGLSPSEYVKKHI